MNDAVMAKWVWKIYINSSEGDPCIDRLRAKYLSNRPFAKSKGWGEFTILAEDYEY